MLLESYVTSLLWSATLFLLSRFRKFDGYLIPMPRSELELLVGEIGTAMFRRRLLMY